MICVEFTEKMAQLAAVDVAVVAVTFLLDFSHTLTSINFSTSIFKRLTLR